MIEAAKKQSVDVIVNSLVESFVVPLFTRPLFISCMLSACLRAIGAHWMIRKRRPKQLSASSLVMVWEGTEMRGYSEGMQQRRLTTQVSEGPVDGRVVCPNS